MKTKLLLICIIVFSFSTFAQEKGQFEKRTYINLEMATGTEIDFDSMWEISTFTTGLIFEQQLSKHWGYSVGIGINRQADVDRNIFSTLAENQFGIKYYSMIINLSLGVHTQTLLSVDTKEYYWTKGFLLGPYMQISKNLQIAQNWQLEPFIKAKFESQSQPNMMIGLNCKYLLK